MTVDAVKTKLTSHVGTSPSAMILQLKDERGSVMATLSPNRKLGYYSPHDGCAASSPCLRTGSCHPPATALGM